MNNYALVRFTNLRFFTYRVHKFIVFFSFSECFDLKVKEYTPLFAKELLNVLGAIVSGSQVR